MIATIDTTQQLTFCGVTEQQIDAAFRRRAGQLAKWGKTDLTWYLADRLPGIPEQTLIAAYALAFSHWAAVCGLTFHRVSSSSQADFVIYARKIDGRNGILAEHQLPPGNDMQLWGRFDLGEMWDAELPLAAGSIDLVAVATHEFGHGIGLGHTQVPHSLMNPYYTPAIRTPQDWDIDQAVRRYGPPIAVPPPADPPTDPADPPGPTPAGQPTWVKLPTDEGMFWVPAVKAQ